MAVKITGSGNKNTRFAGGGIFVVLLGMVLTCWVNTQFLAYRFGFQSALGEAVVSFKRFKIYQPFQWWSWHYQFSVLQGRVQEILTQGVWVILGGCCLSVAAGVYIWYRRSLKVSDVAGLHGTARFATWEDVDKMHLVSSDDKAGGIYLGIFEYNGKQYFLRYDGDAHTLVYAPTRSGKGVGLVLPTLLSYRHSVVVHDLKKENFMLSGGFRHKAGQLTICFEATSTSERSIDGQSQYRGGCYWNALDEIRRWTEFDVMDAQNVAAAIADPDAKGMEDHWVSTSYELLTGIILHMLYAESDKTLSGCSTYLSDPSFTDSEQMFYRMLDAEHDPDGLMGWQDSLGNPTKTHPQVAMAARSMLNKEEKERGSVLSTAKTKLALYTEPIVARNTRHSDFSVRDLMNHDKPVSLYIVVPPSDKERLRPLTRLLVSFMLRRLTEGMAYDEGKSVRGYKHRLQLVLDELPALRKMETLEEGLSYIAGYGINAFLFVQDIIQLNKAYEQNQTITSGCHIKVGYAPNTMETAEEMSKYCGVTTVEFDEVSYSGSRMSSMLGQMNVSHQRIERPLMKPDEILSMGKDDSLIFVTNQPAIRAKKIRYYQVPVFQERAMLIPPTRVGYQYRSEDGSMCRNWMMVSVERTKDHHMLDVAINVYDQFPDVDVTIKQSDVNGEQVMVYDCTLQALEKVTLMDRLEVDTTAYRLTVNDARFRNNEDFEVHFNLRDEATLAEFQQEGFYKMPSILQRLLTKEIKKSAEQQGRDVFFEDIWPGRAYMGTVSDISDDFVVMKREVGELTMISLHRRLRLDKLPVMGKRIRIKYAGLKGLVTT